MSRWYTKDSFLEINYHCLEEQLGNWIIAKCDERFYRRTSFSKVRNCTSNQTFQFAYQGFGQTYLCGWFQALANFYS